MRFLLPIKMMLPPGATMVLSAAGRDMGCAEKTCRSGINLLVIKLLVVVTVKVRVSKD
jgi:hypothetical protein